MSTPRDSAARRGIDPAQAALLSQFQSLPLNFSFANSPGQPHPSNHLSLFDNQIHDLAPHDDGNPDKRSKRLEKNRESARQCRRRKKEYITTLEERVSELTHRIQELQQKYWYTKEKLTEEQRKVAIELSGMVQVPNKERDCAVLLSRFSDICYKQGTAAIIYHLDQLKELLIPAQQVKFVLWGLDQGDEFYENPSRDAEGGTIWSVLSKEIGWTSEQGEQLKRMREIVRRENREIAASILQVEALRSSMCARLESIQRSINEIRNLFTPQQQAKFVVWIEQNSAVMKMLNTIGTHTWLPEIHNPGRPNPGAGLQSTQPNAQSPPQPAKPLAQPNMNSVEPQPILVAENIQVSPQSAPAMSHPPVRPSTTGLKPRTRRKSQMTTSNSEQHLTQGVYNPRTQYPETNSPQQADEQPSFQNPLQAQLQSHLQSQIHQSLQILTSSTAANYPNASSHIASMLGHLQMQNQGRPPSTQTGPPASYQSGLFGLAENQSRAYEPYIQSGIGNPERGKQGNATRRTANPRNHDPSALSRSAVYSSSESDDDDDDDEEEDMNDEQQESDR